MLQLGHLFVKLVALLMVCAFIDFLVLCFGYTCVLFWVLWIVVLWAD